MKNIIYFLFVCVFIISCQQNETAPSEQAGEAAAVTDSEQTDPFYDSTSVFHVAENPSFIVDIVTEDENMPKSKIDMDMFGYRIFVTDAAVECQRIKKEDYENYQIPASAFDACGGWFAGGGEYFYIIKNQGVDFYSVMQAKVFEEQEDPGYPYQSIMNFSKPKK